MLSIIQESGIHTVNVVAHVLFGLAALVVGAMQFMSQKGDRAHLRRGRLFLLVAWISIGTAAVGLAFFEFRTFLAALTLLVAYWAYSGTRALRIRFTGPTASDALVSVAAVAGAWALYEHASQFASAPFVVFWTLGIIVIISFYDLARFAFPRRWFQELCLYEHLLKTVGVYVGFVQASTGMLFGSGQPYGSNQLVTAVLGTSLMLGLAVYFGAFRPELVDKRRVA